jgi:hypothetical protein
MEEYTVESQHRKARFDEYSKNGKENYAEYLKDVDKVFSAKFPKEQFQCKQKKNCKVCNGRRFLTRPDSLQIMACPKLVKLYENEVEEKLLKLMI